MENTNKELQRNIIDRDRTIVNLRKFLSDAQDNLQEEISERNLTDREIASLRTSFTEAMSEHDAFERCASHYKRERDDNDQYIKKLERKLDDRESEIDDLRSRICTYQERIEFLEPRNVRPKTECTIM